MEIITREQIEQVVHKIDLMPVIEESFVVYSAIYKEQNQ